MLGPEGTFTAEAGKKIYPEADLEYMGDVEEVFKYVASGGEGVVAVENSLEGSVGKTLECLMNYDVSIVGEATLDISLCLMKKHGGVKTVMSHPHALAQCKKYLKENYPKARMQAADSTAAAMNKASESDGVAAVGPRYAAEKYGLDVVDEGIEDDPSQTRFIAVSKKQVWGSKTSVIFALKDEPGALYSALKVFSDNGINLTKIESRPSRRKLGEYIFYIDFENNGLDQKGVEGLLDRIRERTTFLKNLGSY